MTARAAAALPGRPSPPAVRRSSQIATSCGMKTYRAWASGSKYSPSVYRVLKKAPRSIAANASPSRPRFARSLPGLKAMYPTPARVAIPMAVPTYWSVSGAREQPEEPRPADPAGDRGEEELGRDPLILRRGPGQRRLRAEAIHLDGGAGEDDRGQHRARARAPAPCAPGEQRGEDDGERAREAEERRRRQVVGP